jgi:hypothetical protein
MIFDFYRTTVFALSERPTERHREFLREKLKSEIQESDNRRAQGAAMALSRGSVLLQQGKARTHESRFQ